MTTLRDYQVNGHFLLNEAIKKGVKKLLWVFPTGAGKSTITADYVRKCIKAGKHVLFMVHKKELVEQFADRLDSQFNIPSGIIMAGVKPNSKRKVQVASVLSLVRREKPKADIIFIDECHHAKANSYVKIIEQYPDAILVGLTATPYRSDGKPLDMFDEMIHPIKIRELIKRGFLVGTKTFVPEKEVDLTGVKIRGGDYDNKEAAGLFMDNEIKEGVAEAYLSKAKNCRAICFNQNVEHSKKSCAYFNHVGIPSGHIDGSMKRLDRERVLNEFKEGKILVIHNYGIVTEGFDVPACDAVILNRATKSKGLWVQMVGRGLRPAKGKIECIIIDAGQNYERFGFVEDYDLNNFKDEESKERKAKKCKACNEGIMQIVDSRKIQDNLGNESSIVTYRCTNCGNEEEKEFAAKDPKKKLKIGEKSEFILLERDAVILSKIQKMTYRRIKKGTAPKQWLRIYAILKGYKNGWAYHTCIDHGYVKVSKDDPKSYKKVNFELELAEMEADTNRIYNKLKGELKIGVKHAISA